MKPPGIRGWMAFGSLAWLGYATVELILSTGIQLWRFPETEILGWQWRLLAMLTGVYAVIGLLMGVAGHLLFRWKRPDPTAGEAQAFVSSSIALAFTINLLSAWPLARSEYIALAVGMLLIVLLATLIISKSIERTRFLANPWTASLLLLGAPWLSRDALGGEVSPVVKTGLSLALLAVVAAVAALHGRLRRGKPEPTLKAQAALLTAVFGAFLAVVSATNRHSAAPSPLSGRTPPPGTPNILLITMDTVRADHTSVYGYERDTTPNLRQFAREATVYTNAIATSDFTLPTHAALFTGLYPNWSGALAPPDPAPGHIAEPLRQDRTTLAEMLRSRGYFTAESVANFGFLGPWTGLTRGFGVADLRRPVTLSTGDRPFYLRAAAKRGLGLVTHTGLLEKPFVNAWDINARALQILEQGKAGGAPFFLFLNYMDAHTPYLPDPPYDRLFPGLDTSLDPYKFHALRLQVNGAKRSIRPNEERHIVAEYDGGVAEVDAAIAIILNRLRELGLYDNTLIVITADHGDTFGEHGLADHFVGFVYQELVRIPMLVKYPGQREAKRSDDLVSQVDIVPTVLELLGGKAPAEIQGRSLLQPAARKPVVFSQGTRSGLVGVGNPRFQGLRRAVFSGSHKLITWTAGAPELYDLAADPHESHNLYRADDPRAIELDEQLRTWVASMPERKAQPRKLDKGAAERLKSLGYIQ
jgi:arylsulfatase A-like enzyme